MDIKQVKSKILERNGTQEQPRLYQPLEHPEFVTWQSHQPCNERWGMIKENLQLTTPHLPRTCLDLGCNTGWFCRKFSHHGWKVIGVDYDPLSIDIAAREMSEFDGTPPPVYVLGDFRRLIPVLGLADVILCLSLVMYLFDNGEQEGRKVLRQLSLLAPKMFLDVGGDCATNMPFDTEETAEYLTSCTTYTNSTLLGRTHLQNRPFFLFTR